MHKSLLITLAIAMASPLIAVAAPSRRGVFPGNKSQRVRGCSSARNSIDVAAYSFTSKPVATALIEAKRRGYGSMEASDIKKMKELEDETDASNRFLLISALNLRQVCRTLSLSRTVYFYQPDKHEVDNLQGRFHDIL